MTSEISTEAAAATPLARWERFAAAALGALLAIAVVFLFLLRVGSSGTMSEYAFKFLPVLTDGGLAAIFDGNAIGDPRPRLLTLLLTYVNIVVRRYLLLQGTIHPSLGIAWLLYPLCIVLISKVAFRLTRDRRAALIAAILFASSPAMLDTLTNYYVPGKALANVMLLLAFYGACIIFPARGGSSVAYPTRGAIVLFTAGLLGLLADETAIFIYLCVPLVFLDRLFDRAVPVASKVKFFAGLAISMLAFALLAFVVVPAVNIALGQVPVDLWTVVTRGVYESMFLTASKPYGALLANVSPGSLLETILSAHTVLHRFVQNIWSSGNPLPHFWAWRWSDQLGLYVFFAILLFLVLNARRDASRKYQLVRIGIAFALFIVVESVMLLRGVSPWIVEVNYYAAFSSFFFALILAILASGLRQQLLAPAAWVITAYLAVVQFSNYYETAQRHPSIGGHPMTWQMVRDTHDRVAVGELAGVMAAHPFPSRLFSIGFEQAVAIEHVAGRRVDLRPMQGVDATIYHFVGMEHLQDPSILALVVPPLDPSTTAGPFGSGDDLARRLIGRTIRGQSEGWEFLAHVSRSGAVRERAWLPGVMRAWGRKGTVVVEGGSLCLRFESYPPECIARTYDKGDMTYGFSESGRLVMSFKWLPEEMRLPGDLRE
ncbi:hypothetical protein V1282_006912 [Nitrobacteraceae bacterium AZCC 2146]